MAQPERVLTDRLRALGEAYPQGNEPPSYRYTLNSLIWRLVTQGYVTLPNPKDDDPDPRIMTLDTNTWIALVKWLYAQVDGPPPRPTAAKEDGGDVLNHFLDQVDADL
jgi:hypothetical protein